ncbi:hypothetical protein G3A43_08895 [Paraburkholderia aspalathi]|nr:hypothetical protein [Paraburkholderia aspalathi]MBK3780375.1 hypothetical protein [Paraburkholderia aspalathi]
MQQTLLAVVWPFWQSLRMLSFRNVQNLPSKFDFDFITLATLTAVMGTARMAAYSKGTPLASLLVDLVAVFLPAFFIPIRSVSAMLLCWLGTDLVGILINLTGTNSNKGFVDYGLMGWGLIAYFVAAGTIQTTKSKDKSK